MTVCSTTALRKYLTQHSNLGQPSREKAVSTTRAHAEGETLINSGRYCRPLFKSSQRTRALQVLVRDNNVDQALRVLKKKMQREGVFREMRQRKAYEKPSERKAREKA